jgi:hypothetical protein
MYLSCLTIVIDIVSYQPKVGRRVLPLFQRSIVLPTWLGMIAMLVGPIRSIGLSVVR